MDYGRFELADRLGAEYAAGLLRGGARRRLETLLPAHPVLKRSVDAWLDRLMPLMQVVEPIPPSPGLWPRIEARLGAAGVPVGAGRVGDPVRSGGVGAGDAGAGAGAGASTGTGSGAAGAFGHWWRGLVFWRVSTGLAGIAAMLLALQVLSPPPVQPPIVVVLGATPAAPDAAERGGVATAAFVAGISADGGAMVMRPLRASVAPPGRALELWSLPPGGAAPRSLGLIAADRATVVERRRLLDGTTGFAVSLEPPGGSPTGAPTGPVIYAGQLGS